MGDGFSRELIADPTCRFKPMNTLAPIEPLEPRIAGDNVAKTPGLKSISVLSLGNWGTSTGAPHLVSAINGAVGTFKVVADVYEARVSVLGGADGKIGTPTIGGSANLAEILAGYGGDTSGDGRGNPLNADAQIGSVRIVGNLYETSIVAGAIPGGDGLFGKDDAQIIALDRTNIQSKISSVIVGGQIIGTFPSDDATHFGMVAQHVVSVTVGGTVSLPLAPGPGTDGGFGRGVGLTRGTAIADGYDFHIREIAATGII
jgi:hypothetical protein